MKQIVPPDTANANSMDRKHRNNHKRLLYKRRKFIEFSSIQTEKNSLALGELRSRVLQSIFELFPEAWKSEQLLPHVVSADGYSVFRIAMGETEFLIAVRESVQGTHVKYAYIGGLETKRESKEFWHHIAQGS